VFDGHTEGWGQGTGELWPVTSMPDDIEAIAEQVFTAWPTPAGGPSWLRWPPVAATATDLAARLPITRQAIAQAPRPLAGRAW